jgi:formate dehydrogenase maturation protein FdhE
VERRPLPAEGDRRSALPCRGARRRCLEPLVEAWYTETSSWDRPDDTTAPSPDLAAFHELFAVALRPFLTRCAHALAPQLDLSGWTDSRCPLCGGEPELAVFTVAGERLLVCGRCGLRWPTPHDVCPFCGNADREQLKSFAGPDGRYRLDACDACLRYVKAYDERHAPRPALPPVDTIATLPLDAAALQQGYEA